jgi:hypothetical protein
MAFDGPRKRDFENVADLNAAYLALLRRDPALGRGVRGCPAPLIERLRALTPQRAARLAATPFLLFSFRESDERYWSRLLENRSRGLFRSSGSVEADTLTAAALAFIWQLARQNPYSLRVICGASLYWCERLAELTSYQLLDAFVGAGEVPVLRLAERDTFWRHLLEQGASRRNELRRAVQLAALQRILTDGPDFRGGQSWAIAASKTRAPGLRVAEDRRRDS